MVLITQTEVNAVFDEQVRLCADTLQKKTKEYTGDDTDRLGAFKAAAALQHATPQRALAGMMAKHIISKRQPESGRERFGRSTKRTPACGRCPERSVMKKIYEQIIENFIIYMACHL